MTTAPTSGNAPIDREITAALNEYLRNGNSVIDVGDFGAGYSVCAKASALRWTNDKPTVPGWYWYRDKPGREEVYRVDYRDGELVICLQEADCLYHQFMDGQFAGPIKEPV